MSCVALLQPRSTTPSLSPLPLYLWTLKPSCLLENLDRYQPRLCPVATRPMLSSFGNPNLFHPTLLRGPPNSHRGTKKMASSLKHDDPSTTSIKYLRKSPSKSADMSPSQYHDLTSSVALYVASVTQSMSTLGNFVQVAWIIAHTTPNQ